MRWLSAVSCILILASCALGAEPSAQDVAFFENKVRPILAEHCFKCHGPKKQESELRVDGRAALLRGGASGPALVAGKPADSLLLKAVRHEGELKMPPARKLDAAAV